MNKNVLSMVALAVLMLGTSAHAAFQSQTLLRLSNDGLIQTIPAVTVNEYAIYAPGSKQPQIVKNAALLYDKRNPLPALTVMGAHYAFFSGGLMATVKYWCNQVLWVGISFSIKILVKSSRLIQRVFIIIQEK